MRPAGRPLLWRRRVYSGATLFGSSEFPPSFPSQPLTLTMEGGAASVGGLAPPSTNQPEKVVLLKSLPCTAAQSTRSNEPDHTSDTICPPTYCIVLVWDTDLERSFFRARTAGLRSFALRQLSTSSVRRDMLLSIPPLKGYFLTGFCICPSLHPTWQRDFSLYSPASPSRQLHF